MQTRHNISSQISLSSRLAVALAVGVCLPGAVRVAQKTKDTQPPSHLSHIITQAEAKALNPGDSISMICSMCKNVLVHDVTKDETHVKRMTIGQKPICADCGGTVTVVGTGKGGGKDEAVKHVCSKCGDGDMFVCATTPGSGAMKDMEKEDK